MRLEKSQHSVLLFAAIVALSAAIPQDAPAARTQSSSLPSRGLQAAIDPHAQQLLQQMAGAYTRLPALDERTEFYSLSVSLQPGPDGKLKPAQLPDPDADPSDDLQNNTPRQEKLNQSLWLLAAQPNRLRIELREPDSTAESKSRFSEWVSDGKWFWTYSDGYNQSAHQPIKQYTKENAPAHFVGFQKIASLSPTSLELMMLLGVNPFADIRDQADRVEYGGTATVHGVSADVVVIRSTTTLETTQARLYIGKADQLLHRVVIETTPVAAPPAPGKVGDALDALVPDGSKPPPAPDAPKPDNDVVGPAAGPMIRRITYDNIIELPNSIPANEFEFKIPQGALLYQPFDLLNRSGKQLHFQDLYTRLFGQKPRRLRIIHP